MDSRYHPKVVNCVQDSQDPPAGYECCTQEVDHLNNPVKNQVYGLYVKQGECDKSTGLVKKSTMSSGKVYKENFVVGTVEGYDGECKDNCNNWRGAFWVLLIVVILMLFVVLNITLKKR